MSSREELIQLYWIEWLPAYKIANKTGINDKMISNRLESNNIPTRKKLINNFCEWLKNDAVDIDYYLHHYLSKKKYIIQKPNTPRMRIGARSRQGLVCLARYLRKNDITSCLSYEDKIDIYYLIITGMKNFKNLSRKFKLSFWEKLKDSKEICMRHGEAQKLAISALREDERLSTKEILSSLGWRNTVKNRARVFSALNPFVEKGLVEKEKDVQNNYMLTVPKSSLIDPKTGMLKKEV